MVTILTFYTTMRYGLPAVDLNGNKKGTPQQRSCVLFYYDSVDPKVWDFFGGALVDGVFTEDELLVV